MTNNPTALAVVEDSGELPDVIQFPDGIYEEDDEDSVVYIDEDNDEAKYLMGVLNYDDAG